MTDLLCSAWSKANDVDPVGSAGSYRGFLVVDWPLPWPRDISEIPQLAEVAAAASSQRVRLQARVPQGEQSLSVAYWRWDGARGRYTGLEAPAGQAAATAMTFLEGGLPDGAGPVDGTEILVCGHGRRDRCCGSLGTSLAIELTAAGNGSGVRVRRTSHTGGHRFAATAIVLPEGSCWGYLDARTAGLILGRVGPVDDVAPLYRGCTGLPSPQAQALEREVLRVFGWGLLDRPRRAVEQPDGRVGLEVELPSGETRTWTAKVAQGRVLPVPNCGAPVEQAGKTQAELRVEDLVETTV